MPCRSTGPDGGDGLGVSHLDGLIIDVDEGERGRVQVASDGRESFESKLTLTQEGYERLRTGYLCGRCLEDLTPLGAFPEKCPCCGFRVRKLQLEQLNRDFVGEEHVGPRTTLSDELARLKELWLPNSY
jgi:hypothetical protein